MLEIVVAALIGSINNVEGFIGVVVSRGGRVMTVHKTSPAMTMQIASGDVILSCNGVKGIKGITGPAYSLAHLTIKRNNDIVELDCVRLPREFIND